MARYRAKASLFTDRLIPPGEEFTSDATPGRNWEPLDDEAKAKVVAMKRPAPPAGLEPAAPLIAIPDDWSEWSGKKQIALAHKLGAPAKGTTAEVARQFIEREIANRGHTTSERTREAA